MIFKLRRRDSGVRGLDSKYRVPTPSEAGLAFFLIVKNIYHWQLSMQVLLLHAQVTLPYFFPYNTILSESLGVTSFSLFFGRIPCQ